MIHKPIDFFEDSYLPISRQTSRQPLKIVNSNETFIHGRL